MCEYYCEMAIVVCCCEIVSVCMYLAMASRMSCVSTYFRIFNSVEFMVGMSLEKLGPVMAITI